MFTFRLQRIMMLRQAEREERRRELAEAHRAEAIVNEQMTELNEEMKTLQQTMRLITQPGEVDVDRQLAWQRHGMLLRGKRQHLQENLKILAEEAERRRLRLVEADRQVQVLEKLREKQLAEYEKQQLRSEQYALDEIAGRGREALS